MKQSRWKRLTNNVLTRKELIVLAAVFYGLGALTAALLTVALP